MDEQPKPTREFQSSHFLNELQTPAFVYDENVIQQAVNHLKKISAVTGCKVLFSLKSFALVDALELIARTVDGFATSSIFEALLARQVLKSHGSVHITSPGLRSDEIQDLSELCDYISFNSLSQLRRFRGIVRTGSQFGLRINPQLSFLKDDRYNPCREHSKLGVPLNALRDSPNTLQDLSGISGVHFHTNCESISLDPLWTTVQQLDRQLETILKEIQWINLGGGYQYDEIDSWEPLYRAIDLLKSKYELDVFIEPGEAIVGNAGYLISSVVDLFDTDGKTLAVLDTSVNHMPQVFEYQYRPEVSNAVQNGKYNYILAGSTCLAGDILGEYRFDAPLDIGSKVVFEFMGAYTLVKAHMFNGVNLPSIYAINDNFQLILKKQYTFQDYLFKWKDPAYETARNRV